MSFERNLHTSQFIQSKIKNVEIEILDGDRSSKYPKKSEFTKNGIPFLNSAIIVNHKLKIEESNFISPEKFSQIKKGRLKKDDIIFTTRGNGVGKTAIFNHKKFSTGLINAQMLILRVNPCFFDSHYVYYYITNENFQQNIKNFASGSAQPQLPIQSLKEMEISYPTLPTQKKIAAILSAYDDLIENNTRRIKILEEMAQSLYREWFVEFRFPGHEDVEMVDDGCGRMIPEGWEVVPILDAIEVNPRIKIPKDGLKPFLPMGYLSETSMLIHGFEYREGNSGSKFQNGDTLFARITPCLENGKTAFVQFLQSDNEIGFGSTEFIVLRSKSVTPEFVYLLARTEEFRDHAIKSMSGATGRQRVRTESLEQYLIAHPDKKSLEFFTGIVRPMFEEINNLAKKNQNLTQTRDLLLPRLIEGEVDVSKIEISS